MDFWRNSVAFYLDGVGFSHKSNPAAHARTLRTRSWRKANEGLKRTCLAKGKKEGVGGRMANFMVAFAYGKGVIGCHHYEGHWTGETFGDYVKKEFPKLFEKGNSRNGKLFLQDGDPRQNARAAVKVMNEIDCNVFSIPARSPDLNPIENLFHRIRKQVNKDSLSKIIEKEPYEQFCRRIENALYNFLSLIHI